MCTKLIAVFIAVQCVLLGATMASEVQQYPVKASSEKELKSLLESKYASCRYIVEQKDGVKIVAVFRDTGFGVFREDLFIYSVADSGEMTLVAMMPYSRVPAKNAKIEKGVVSVLDNDGNVLLSGKLQPK